MQVQVQIQNLQRTYKKQAIQTIQTKLEKALTEAWTRSKAGQDERIEADKIVVNLMFIGTSRMRSTNKETRGIDQTTDVLSFPAHEMSAGELLETPQAWDYEYSDTSADESDDPELIFNLGDILLSLEAAAKQASDFGHSEEREIVYLAVHGCLHLLGYDHETEEGEADMKAEAEAIMLAAGLDRDSGTNVLSEQGGLEEAAAAEEEEDSDELAVLETVDKLFMPEALADGFVSGFIAIVGRPNVGKSTLLNRLTGSHIAITSAKAQTTRSNIRSIVNRDTAQLVFVDTPGLHKTQHRLDEHMKSESWSAAEDADLILLMLDAGRPQITQMEKNVVAVAERTKKPIILAINKSDDLAKPDLLPIIARFHRLYPFTDIVPISAQNGDGVEELLDLLQKHLPEGPKLFDDEDYTDQSERQLAAEYIREQILFYLHQEIPHGTAVLIDSFEEILADNAVDAYDRSLVRIEASILVDRDGHKGIVIGKNGSTLKRISSSARIKLETLLGCKVYLKCFVKVRPDWRNRTGILNSLGFAAGDQKKK